MLNDNLATIARSVTACVGQQVGNKQEGANLIRQFGVGFYSAFMVAERVDVSTRRDDDAEGWKWTTDGRGAFTIAEDKDAQARGTRITLHLREGEKEYLDAPRMRQIVHTYSEDIAVQVVLSATKEDETDETRNAGA